MGMVNDIFHEKELAALTGPHAIGQVRYSTAGTSELKNAQPFVIDFIGGNAAPTSLALGCGPLPPKPLVLGGSESRLARLVDFAQGPLAVVHNGNLTNALALRKQLEKEGAVFQSTMDTEVIMHLAARSSRRTLEEKITDALSQVTGAYCLVFLSKDKMIAARDPKGFRPLVLGRKDETYVAASETCALDLIDAQFVRDVEPGEIVIWDKQGQRSLKPFAGEKQKGHCIFEYVYFARPDSHIFGRDVYEIRKGFGRQLAKEHPAVADMVIPVPDSGMPAAIGYAEESGLPFQMGLIRNHYVGRTFIEPEDAIRHFGVKIKLNPVRELLQGKRVVVVDDSIVRGTTCMKIVKMLRERGGAKEVHVRISSPPIAWPCFYGINTPTRKELIAAHQSVEEIR
ncbi:MAG: amidophosphoribosyltransferase, partial [Deltaproteobacteria bacterium]|nr:amidophosphoribosyltransferase [Deltaproteobacteria bacterium]